MAAPFVAPNFNPLHREGGDRYILRTQSGQPRFQSTPPRGWRRRAYEPGNRRTTISIHSTARVETMVKHPLREWEVFQSTPPRGWRLCGAVFFIPIFRFQSTPPRGWRPFKIIFIFYRYRFQSTPPRGWRRDTTSVSRLLSPNFNPLHREGGDPFVVRSSFAPKDFNPLHREGGDCSGGNVC